LCVVTGDGVPADSYDEDDDDTAVLRVYTDTLEGEPQTSTDVKETEETLPDGTVIRRRVTTTRQQQTIVKRVIMEGPENELPTNEDEAEQLLQQTDLATEDEVPSMCVTYLIVIVWRCLENGQKNSLGFPYYSFWRPRITPKVYNTRSTRLGAMVAIPASKFPPNSVHRLAQK